MFGRKAEPNEAVDASPEAPLGDYFSRQLREEAEARQRAKEKLEAQVDDLRGAEASAREAVTEYKIPLTMTESLILGNGWAVVPGYISGVLVKSSGQGPHAEPGYGYSYASAGKSIIALLTTAGRELPFECWPHEQEIALEQCKALIARSNGKTEAV